MWAERRRRSPEDTVFVANWQRKSESRSLKEEELEEKKIQEKEERSRWRRRDGFNERGAEDDREQTDRRRSLFGTNDVTFGTRC